MISKTSLFNKGIYKTTLRRYAWGSILYFIMLFLMTSMVILLSVDPKTDYSFYSIRTNPLILSTDFVIFPMLFTMAVPTVTGLLIFRFIHSRKASVFIHSLPVKREANYISSVLAGLTLMALPVVLNTAVLIIISLCGYSSLFSPSACVLWMLLNIFALFAMFSCVCFVSSITGNSFALVALNILIHIFVLLLAAGFEGISSVFLHGFSDIGTICTNVLTHTFPVNIANIMTGWNYTELPVMEYGGKIVEMVLISVLFYIFGCLLYKIRRMETAEDVAGFKCLNIIFKYLLTFIVYLGVFSILSFFIDNSPVTLWCMVFITGAVVYFGSEMLLKKTLRVIKSYKGFLIVSASFVAVICIFAFTSFFGYETYIPEKDSIEKVAVYEYYNESKPYISSKEGIEKVIKIHSKLIEAKEITNSEAHDTRINIEYTLKNGMEIHRRYNISDELFEIMNTMYENEEYKTASERVFTPIESVYKVNFNGENVYEEIKDEEKINELIECVKEDIKSLSYSSIHSEGWSFGIEIEYKPLKEEKDVTLTTDGEVVRFFNVSINANFKKTLEWIKGNGYWDIVSIKNDGIFYIARDYTELPFFDSEGRLLENNDPIKEKNIIKIEDKEKMQKIIDYLHEEGMDYIPDEKRYYIYEINDSMAKDYKILSVIDIDELNNLK